MQNSSISHHSKILFIMVWSVAFFTYDFLEEDAMAEIAYNDNQQLAFTQGKRRDIIEAFTTGRPMPDDPKLVALLLAAMKDYDKVTLTLKRIDADTENSDADRQALMQFHRISAMAKVKNLDRVDASSMDVPDGPQTPFDPTDIPSVSTVPGELAMSMEPIDYDEFMEKQGRIHREAMAKEL